MQGETQTSVSEEYQRAQELFERKEYQKAYDIYVSLKEYKDAGEKTKECCYFLAQNEISSANYEEAIALLQKIEDYSDVQEVILQCRICQIMDLVNSGKFNDAYNKVGELKGSIDTTDIQRYYDYARGVALFAEKKYSSAGKYLMKVVGYQDSNAYLLKLAKKFVSQNKYVKAKEICDNLPDSNKTQKIREKIAFAQKYENYVMDAKFNDMSDYADKLTEQEVEKFLEELVYGKWLGYETGKEFWIDKSKRNGKAYGIYTVYREDGWYYIYYYYQKSPKKIYCEAWHEVSVPGGESQPFLESMEKEGVAYREYCYAKMTESEMWDYADEVQKNDKQVVSSSNSSRLSGNSANTTNSSNKLPDSEAYRIARSFLPNACSSKKKVCVIEREYSISTVTGAYDVAFYVSIPAENSHKYLHIRFFYYEITGECRYLGASLY